VSDDIFFQAQEALDAFLEQDHVLEEFAQEVQKYHDLETEIPFIFQHTVTMGIFEMHREDFVAILAQSAKNLKEQVLTRMTQNYQKNCKA